MRDTELRNEIIENAQVRSREKYDWGLVAKSMRDEVLLPTIKMNKEKQ